MKHDCPQIMASRYGCWSRCRCGWNSNVWTRPFGASLDWARHVLEESR